MAQRLLPAAKRVAGTRIRRKPAQTGFLRLGVMVTNYGSGVFTDTNRISRTSLAVFSPQQTTNRQAWQSYWATRTPKGRHVFYKTLTETASKTGTTNYAAVVAEQTVATATRRDMTSIIPAEEVKYHDANFPADQWQLYSAGGQPLHYGSFTQSWIIDPAAATMQAQAYTYLIEQIQAQAWDGVFWDNILVTSAVNAAGVQVGFPMYRKDSGNNLVVAYATQEAYADAMENCVNGVGDLVRNAGYFVVANTHWFKSGEGGSNTGVAVQAFWNRISPHVSVCLGEYSIIEASTGFRRSTDNVQFYDYLDGWSQDLINTAKANGAGTSLGVGSQANSTDANIRYATAVLRTKWDYSTDSQVSFFTTNGFWPSSAVVNIDWGTPVGSLFTDATGKLRGKRWSGAWAVANTSRTTVLSATWTDPVTGLPRSFTIQPIDAYIGA